MKKATNTTKIILTVLSALILIDSLVVFFIDRLNFGTLFTFLFGIFVLVAAFLSKHLLKSKLLFVLLCALLSFALIWCCFLFLYADTLNGEYSCTDAAVVFGTALNDDELIARLDKAVCFAKNNPEGIVIVSGGTVGSENISEAEFMMRYLTANGVQRERIIKEEKALSTYENVKNCKEILDVLFEDGYTVSFISSDYHALRISLIAEKFNVPHCFYTSDTSAYLYLPRALRETAALLRYFILGY